MNRAVFGSFTILCLLSASLTTRFIQVVKADSGSVYIRADGSVDPETAPIIRNGNFYTLTGNINGSIVIEKDNTVIDGNKHVLQGAGEASGTAISLSGRTNVTVQNMQITDYFCAIELDYSSNNSIFGNNITANIYDGIYLITSSNNSIANNTISIVNGTDLSCGVRLDWSSNNSISENKITHNSLGIALGFSSNNSISDNNVTANSDYGICLVGDVGDGSSNNTISGNVVANSDEGILLSIASDHNVICENDITCNRRGIDYLQVDEPCTGNIVYHNNFENNSQQAINIYMPVMANAWDNGYPSGGNYWSDYNGTDANHDGIGDTPYIIDANNTDNYPLMGMFYSFNVSWVDSGYIVDLISNSTISGFDVGILSLEDPNSRIISFNVTGENDTVGFCRILIPTALMDGTYRILINGTEAPSNLLQCSNSTHSYLYFNYTHSTQEVIIIPEFPSFPILPLFMISILLAVIIYKKKGVKTRQRSIDSVTKTA